MAKGQKPKRAQLPLRVPESLRAQIEKAAEEHGVSMNAEMISRLQSSFDREKGDRVGELESKVNAIMTALQEQGADVKKTVEGEE